MLDLDDVSVGPTRFPLRDTVKYEYPVGERFLLQVIGDVERDALLDAYPNNTAAAFKRGTNLPKPSALLLHYNYGAAVVKLWGHRTEVLDQRNIPRPRVVTNRQPGRPPRHKNNRLIAIRKREGHGNPGDDSGEASEVAEVAGGGATDVTDNPTVVVRRPMVGYREWDEDDWMLFLWGNTPAARERYRAADEESFNRISRWATEVSNPAFV